MKDIKHSLTALPETLDETYDRILLGIDPAHVENTRVALGWLVFAERPLLLSELSEASVIRPEATVPFDIDDRFASEDGILQVLTGLITTQKRGTLGDDSFYAPVNDGDDEIIVRLAHFSVKEYLVSSRILGGAASMFSLNESISRRMILEGCLSYLEYYCHCSKYFDEDDQIRYPLLCYSVEYWPKHAKSLCNYRPSTYFRSV